MGNENTNARFAPPSLQRNRSYLGRIRGSADGQVMTLTGIDLYDSTSLDVSDPFTTTAEFGEQFGGITNGALDFASGAPVNNLFCVIDVFPDGRFSLIYNGIHFGWFRFRAGPPHSWVLVTRGGIAQVFICSEEPAVPCNPFAEPFGYLHCEGAPVVNLLGSNQPAFCSAGVMGWRLEYQACDPDDEDNDSPPGIRSPFNFLSANCCSSSSEDPEDEDDGLGDSDDEEEDDGGGGDEDPPADCRNLGLSCVAIAQECIHPGPPATIFHRWCISSFGCFTGTGGRCFCQLNEDINGDPLPLPGSVPPGTAILVHCANSAQGAPCSDDPTGFDCGP